MYKNNLRFYALNLSKWKNTSINQILTVVRSGEPAIEPPLDEKLLWRILHWCLLRHLCLEESLTKC
jgi:hypothetical protein